MGLIDRVYSKAEKALVPLNVHIDLTYRCHHRCLHCYLPEVWRRGEGKGSELDTAQVKVILDQLAAAGAFFLTFSGGEIFLRPDILPILAHARNLNFSLSLMSSGTMGLEDKQIEALAELGVAHLIFSMYSMDPAVHDRITGVPGSCAKLIRSIEACRARDLQVVLNCLVFSLNRGDIMALKNFSDRHNLSLRLSYDLSPRWDGRSNPAEELALGEEEARRFMNSLGLGQPQGPTEKVTTPLEVENQGCGAGSILCYIDPGGEVWPCVEVPLACGSLGQDPDFPSIWEGSPALHWVRQAKTGPAAEMRFCDYYRTQGEKDGHFLTLNQRKEPRNEGKF
jgi:MoaA/NifB/PqqE/SkfB family radical SAM enzyme